MTAALRFEGAVLGRGGRAVLAGVDFAVPDGAFVGILGPNGAGKTTLIRSLLGLSPCLGGRVESRGRAGGAARFGYVPQKEALDPLYPLTCRAVAAMGTRRSWSWPGLGGALRREQAERRLAQCGAAELADRRFGELSGGQRQRVLLARALAADPEILVMDEPLAGIDAETQEALLGLFDRLKAGGGLTALMVSHRIRAERGLFTHVVWVEGGSARLGPAAEVLASERLQAAFRSGL